MSRMTLQNVKKGRIVAPIKAMIVGDEGSGKSTYAAGAPDPIWIALDERTNHLDVARAPQPQSWDEYMEFLGVLDSNDHKYKTVVTDPVGWLEPLLWKKITGDPLMSAAKWEGGYGKLPEAAMPHWRMMISALERLWRRGMNIVIIGHTTLVNVNPPNEPSYNFIDLALNKKAAGLLRQWCDYVLFLRAEQSIKVDPKTKKVSNAVTGLRWVYSEPTGAFAAKFTGLPPGPLPPEWSALEDAIKASDPKHAVGIRERIIGKAGALLQSGRISKEKLDIALAKAKDDVRALVAIERTLDEKAEEGSEEQSVAAPASPPPSPVAASVPAPAPAPAPTPAAPVADPAIEKLRADISAVANKIGDVEVMKKIIGYVTEAGGNMERLHAIHDSAVAKFEKVKQEQLDRISALLKEINDNATGVKVGELIVGAKTSEKGEVVRLREIVVACETKLAKVKGQTSAAASS